ncbi:MAG TPA: FMN-dependent NADH-azoreductase [Rudaea sp.]|nr:FMN-dependent NADH-azoreductase [Rudaea sp.]
MKLLHIDSSILGDGSASRELSAAWVAAWRERHPHGEVRYRDLAREPLPHLTGEVFAARNISGLPGDANLAREVEADRAAIAEFLDADVVVIGAPMYNFAIPSQLKTWIDRIVVAGKTFRYGANGPEGLARGKKAVIVISRGGVYTAGPAAALDFQETYLRGVLGFIGITDVDVIRAEGLSHGPEHRSHAMTAAHRAVAEPVALAA